MDVQTIRDILISIYLVGGILLTLLMIVFALLLFLAARGVIRSAKRATDNVGKVTDAAVEHIVEPLQEGVSLASTVGNAFGFATGFFAGMRGRRKRGGGDKGGDGDKGRRGRGR